MNIDHLREFSYLADSLNFSETARHFFLSQSVLSKHIAAMEKEINAKLFDRSPHQISLTKQGQAFKKDTDIIIDNYDTALFHLKAIEEGYIANLDVAYLRGASKPFLHKFLMEMEKHCPEVRVNLYCLEYWELSQTLEAKKLTWFSIWTWILPCMTFTARISFT